MTEKKLLKFVEKPLVVNHEQKKHAILISSSKGNYIKPHSDILYSVNYNVEFVCRGGATFPEQFCWLQRNLHYRVRTYSQIVLFIWLGTCDLTQKHGKFIQLKHCTEEEAVNYFIYQTTRFMSYVSHFPSVKIVFLEVPPYSISEWNKYKGHTSPDQFHVDDITLNNRIILVDEFIRQVTEARNFSSPRFKLDVLRYTQEKNGPQRSSVNYNLFKDGIPPKPGLARYWMKRFVIKVTSLC